MLQPPRGIFAHSQWREEQALMGRSGELQMGTWGQADIWGAAGISATTPSHKIHTPQPGGEEAGKIDSQKRQ